MADANKLYSHIELLEDDTNGLIQLDIVERKHDTRRAKQHGHACILSKQIV